MNNETEEQTCYICLEKVKKHIPVCQCQKVCHLKCLHQWITDPENSNRDKCDICQENYIDLRPYFKEIKTHPVQVIIWSLIGFLTILGVSSYWIYIIIKAHHTFLWTMFGIFIALSICTFGINIVYQHYYKKKVEIVVKIIE